MFNVHKSFMCKRQEHVISCVPYPTELSYMLVTCYTVIWIITQLYAQVFLTSSASHSSRSMCCSISSLHHRNAHQLLATLCKTHNFSSLDSTIFFVPVDTFLYRNKTNTFVKKENNTCNSENNFLIYNKQGSATHQQNT